MLICSFMEICLVQIVIDFMIIVLSVNVNSMLNIYRYSFYDGPPFATGLPHYGHILAGTIKVSIVEDLKRASPN